MNRANVIENLSSIGDPLVKLFKNYKLKPIMNDSAYHSPENSETDDENLFGKRKIVVKDLKWRSIAKSLMV